MRSENFYKAQFGKWFEQLKPIVYSERFDNMLSEAYSLSNGRILPEKRALFAPFRVCSPDNLKLVIIGEKPRNIKDYNGLALADNPECMKDSFLTKTIWNKIEEDFWDGLLLNNDISMMNIAKQGVLMINSSMTTSYSNPEDHEMFWEPFVAALIRNIIKHKRVPFLLFGEETFKYTDILKAFKIEYSRAKNPRLSTKWEFSFKRIHELTNKEIKWM